MNPKSRAAGVVAVVLALLAGGVRADAAAARHCGRFAQAPRFATGHQLRTSVLCLINRVRERHGLRRLRFNRDLRQAATAHSMSMVSSGVFSHYGPGASTPKVRIAHSGYLAGASSFEVAENIGTGAGRRHGSPLAIVLDWMHSPAHRSNILDHGLRDFGVGVARGKPLGGGGGRNPATYTLDLGARRH